MFGEKIVYRLFATFGVIIFLVVVVRLAYLQILEGEKYSLFVKSQVNSQMMINKYRGYIYDKDGEVLAQNKSVASLYAFRRNIDNSNEFIRKLNKNGITLSKKTKDSLLKSNSFTWISRKIELDRAKKLVKSIEGLEYYKEESRFYPQGSSMANIIGFTGVDNQGRAGLEFNLDKILSGKGVPVASIKDSRGRLILFEDKTLITKPDTEVYLTLSSKLQASAEYILRKGAERFGARNGSVLAMDIKSGDILVSANVLGFDPHNYNKYSAKSWRNHPFTYVYEPGSVFKTVAFSYMYENNKLDRNKSINTSSRVTIGGYTYSDTKDYGTLTVDEVFTKSSNIGMVKLIKSIDNKDFYEFLLNSGFGSKSDIYGISEESGVLKSSKEWSSTSKSSISIGYEVLVTPLQIVRFYGALANNGVMVTPKVISKIVKHGKVIDIKGKEKRIVSEETANYMLDLMSKAVTEGTGVRAKTKLVTVAGKTGTASIYDAKNKRYSKQNYSASFAGVFPAENPKIAMIVVYEAPTSSIFGGSTAANVFRQIAEYISTEMYYIDNYVKVDDEAKAVN